MRLDEVGNLVRRVVQETTERVTQFATTQTVTKDRPATVVTAGAQGQQPTYPMAPFFYSPANLFRPVQYSPSPAPGAPATPPPLQINLTSAPAGQTIYEVQPGDSLNSIAAQHGLTADDIRLTNPQYADGQIDPGDKLFLYYDKAHPDVAAERLDIAHKIKATSDPAELASLVQQDLQLATRYSAIPGDSVPGLKTHLLGLKPGDQGFAKIVNTEVDKALTDWDAQGRTHEVWDPLIQAAEAGDWGKFEEVLLQQFGTAAAATPTTQTVENHKNMLLTFGPKDPAFRTAVEGGTNEFLIGRPQRAAGQVAQAFEEGGAVAGANKLKELTDPAKVDPLTAALILKASRPTVDKIVNVAASYDPSPADPYGGPPPANQRFDITDYHLVFSGLNSAADSASRSPEGMPEVTYIAGRLNASPVLSPMGSYYPNVNFGYQNSVAQGDGVVLLLEMAKLAKTSGDPHKAGALTRLVVGGVEDLKENVRTQVGNLGEAALPLVEPIANWGGDEQLINRWLAAHPELLAKIDAELAKLDIAGYELNRAIAMVNQYAPQLEGIKHHDQLVAHGKMPTLEDDPELAYAMASGPASMSESVRQGNLELLQHGDLDNPYLIMPDPSWPTRMFRNHVQAYYKPENKPASVGLSLFGTGTYVWGVGAHGTELMRKIRTEGLVPAIFKEDGWRNSGFVLMYGAGIVIEGRQAWALRSGEAVWKTAFVNHLKAFGWWNVIGTVNYAAQGDIPRTIALGAAAGGTLLSTSSLAQALRFVRIGGTVATLIGSAALFVMDMHDKAALAARTEPYNKEFLIMAGVKPEIANILADNDGDGVSPAGRLAALAQYRGVSLEEMINYINGLDERDVRLLVNAANDVPANDDGTFAAGNPDERNFTSIPMWDPMLGDPAKQFLNPSVIQPSTIVGLNWWATRFMPGMPMASPGGSPPNGPGFEYWVQTPEGKAWQANQDLQKMAGRMHLPTTPVG